MAEEQKHLRRDFLGHLLCDHCWNGMHEMYKTDRTSGHTQKMSNCLGHGCECLCTQVQAHRRARRARDHYTIPESTD